VSRNATDEQRRSAQTSNINHGDATCASIAPSGSTRIDDYINIELAGRANTTSDSFEVDMHPHSPLVTNAERDAIDAPRSVAHPKSANKPLSNVQPFDPSTGSSTWPSGSSSAVSPPFAADNSLFLDVGESLTANPLQSTGDARYLSAEIPTSNPSTIASCDMNAAKALIRLSDSPVRLTMSTSSADSVQSKDTSTHKEPDKGTNDPSIDPQANGDRAMDEVSEPRVNRLRSKKGLSTKANKLADQGGKVRQQTARRTPCYTNRDQDGHPKRQVSVSTNSSGGQTKRKRQEEEIMLSDGRRGKLRRCKCVFSPNSGPWPKLTHYVSSDTIVALILKKMAVITKSGLSLMN
jgi:hypothetical protein